MNVQLQYSVTYKDFLVSTQQWRQRSSQARYAYNLYLWTIPSLSAITVCIYFVGLANGGSIVPMWLAAICIGLAFGMPLRYRAGMRKAFQRRVALTEGNNVSLEANDKSIRFSITGKIDVNYEWSAFTSFSEKDGVLSLFVKDSAFHTIPQHTVTAGDWEAFRQLVATHVRKI